MRRQLIPALRALLAFTVLTGLLYPLAMTGIAQALFEDRADGSLLRRGDQIVGSSLLGQEFESDRYFHPRPSAAGYDGGASGASNLGPSNPELLRLKRGRTEGYRRANGLADDVEVPIDAITASASGLDPHISLRNAQLQSARVAGSRGLAVAAVLELVRDRAEAGRLNVLELNLALDRLRR
jgi:K+-transporting ATPase ATPase C chain